MAQPAIKRKTTIIDATGKPMGRLAVEVAINLRGKNKPTFQPHIDAGDIVIVTNIEKMKFTGKKMDQKNYFHFTGYLGNMKQASLKELIIKKGEKEALRRAVLGMLAKNRLRDKQIKRLKFEK